ncbi:MAG TPA: tRNA (adenosine(37)-N6)-threonylcarbamoyltransferase complex ATPase subunit type 1 TsaE [Pyrinomonadaceae bacterium]|nr:tRNA (adenosine(37)-N6)-threonylcarbamoyltransferase complex ATPase subunit type 1 TsaE [Pyrinomonadaceae bacterium]
MSTHDSTDTTAEERPADAAGGVPVGEWTSRGVEETFAVGARVGRALAGGEVLLLAGPLGAGKTVFVKGVADGLGVDVDEVTSPSFTLVNRYDGGRLTLYHLDLYRLAEGAQAAYAVDLDELLSEERAVIVIEWAERMGGYPLPPEEVWRVSIEGDGEDPRLIRVSRGADVS